VVEERWLVVGSLNEVVYNNAVFVQFTILGADRNLIGGFSVSCIERGNFPAIEEQ
jgi:hypothetical protein